MDHNPEKINLERVSNHLKEVCKNLGLDELKMPVSPENLQRIEEKFKVNIKIFGHDGRDIFPLGHIKDSSKKLVNLLFTCDEKTGHCVWIKDLNKLCSKVTKHAEKSILWELYTIFLEQRKPRKP